MKLQGYTDYFQEKLFNGFEPGYDYRQTLTTEFGVSQVLTPKTIARLIYDHTHQWGNLATTYNSVFINGSETTEEAPSTRRRDSATFRIRQAITEETALDFAYRYYNDSWGIDSNTFESTILQYLFDRKVLFEPHYRYYKQTGAFFYAEEFFVVTENRTSDSDLAAFDGRVLGAKVTLIRPEFLSAWNADIDVSFSYYERSDNLDFYWTILGYRMRF